MKKQKDRNQEIKEAVERINAGQDVSNSMMILYNNLRGMILKIAKKFQARAEIEDLLQEGYFGIVKALETYKPDKGCSFQTHAYRWIWKTIQRYVYTNCGAVRIPAYQNDLISKYRSFARDYITRHGSEPSREEIAEALNISMTRLMYMEEGLIALNACSLSAPISNSDGDDLELSEVIIGNKDEIADLIDNEALCDASGLLTEAISKLTDRQANVISARYIEGKTRGETSKQLKISRPAVSDLEKRALINLRENKRLKEAYLQILEVEAYRNTGLGSFVYSGMSAPERAVIKGENYLEYKSNIKK